MLLQNSSVRDREKIRWTTPDSWCECATYWGCWVWMASTDVLHVSCMGGQSLSVSMRELFTEPTGCLNAPQLFITSPSSFALHWSTIQPHNLWLPSSRLSSAKSGFCYQPFNSSKGILCVLLREECKETKCWRQKKARKWTMTEQFLFRRSV